MHTRPTRILAFLIAILSVSGLVVACSKSKGSDGTGSAVSTAVTVAEGGSVSLPDGTSVTIPAGAVSADTTVRLSREQTISVPSAGILSAGLPVTISLDDDVQLTAPVRIELPVMPPDGWPADLPLAPFAAYLDEASQTWVAVDSTFDESRKVLVALVEHFSWWNPFTWDYRAIGNSVKQALADLIGVPSGVPVSCASPVSPGPDAVTVMVAGTELVDWCLDRVGDRTVLRMRGSVDFPLLVTWSGAATLLERTEYAADLVSAYRWLSDQLGLQAADAVAIPTGGSVDLAVAPDATAPVYVKATWDSHVQLVGIVDATARVVMALRDVLGLRTTAEEVVDAALDGTCLYQHADDLLDDPAGATVTILTDCLSDVIGELTRAAGRGLLRVIGAVPGVVAALLGVVGYAVNQFFVSLGTAGGHLLASATDEKLTLYIGEAPVVSSGPDSGWPERDGEGPPTLYAWLGASFLGFPDFVSCTDDGQWCIVAIEDEVHIFSLKPIRDRGSVPRASADPTAALTAKGLSPSVVAELLRDG